jgi:dolichol-phosphate mannosyltransferase
MSQNCEREDPISLLFVVNNEEETIEKTILSFINEINKETPLQIVVAEDGSTDKTKEILLELENRVPLKLVTGNKKKGYMNATKDGLMTTNSKWVFITDSDGQFVPSDFWKLQKEVEKYDLIIGWKKNRADPPWRILMSKTYHLLVRAIFGLPVHDPNTAFRFVEKKMLKDITHETKYLKHSFWTEFTIRAFRRGYSLTETPINHRRRQKGKSHIYNIKKFPQMLISQITGLFKLWKELRKQSPSNKN